MCWLIGYFDIPDNKRCLITSIVDKYVFFSNPLCQSFDYTHLFSLFKQPKEWCHGTYIKSMSTYTHDVVQYSGDLCK